GFPDAGAALRAARAIGFPVLIKASAGGGGKGMRLVADESSFAASFDGARREAESAFGDGAVYIERAVIRPRHVEIQIFCDGRGGAVHLGERDCSIQRRHQKVIEETPAPGISDDTRRALADAAAAGAKAIGYVGAGTAEFLLAPDGRFFFLEMNTRLQVEHPVTELVTGLDLVAWQLRIAEGRALPADPPTPRGHAIEARLYAEDPAHDWQPRTGTVRRFEIPEAPGIRVDSGIETGSVVGVEYDAMLAKVIAWADTREEAARLLGSTLAGARIHGLTTNRELLARVLNHPAFIGGDVHTAFLTDHADDLFAASSISPLIPLAAALADAASYAGPHPSAVPSGWRNLTSQPQFKRYLDADGTEYEVRYRHTRDGLRAEGLPDVRLVSSAPDHVVLEERGVRRTFDIAAYEDAVYVDRPGESVALTSVSRFPDPTAEVDPGSLLAPMPGTVARVAVLDGEPVVAGQPLLWLEAMKMEHLVVAPADGIRVRLHVQPGQQVSVGTILAVVDPQEGPQP
ncbi:MAG TPA: biotin/lipoyl-containing protein, partial [Actinospica sp.]|nr:biotin/lipoyl-containing protein [Actinospica sp.]